MGWIGKLAEDQIVRVMSSIAFLEARETRNAVFVVEVFVFRPKENPLTFESYNIELLKVSFQHSFFFGGN